MPKKPEPKRQLPSWESTAEVHLNSKNYLAKKTISDARRLVRLRYSHKDVATQKIIMLRLKKNTGHSGQELENYINHVFTWKSR